MAAVDIPALLRSLDLSRQDEAPDLGQLTATWNDPPSFRKALFAYAAERTGSFRSVMGSAYDLYTDSVYRHASGRQVAFVEVLPRADPVRLTFSALHAQASSLAALWTALGVKPGAAIALVLPPHCAAIIAFAAALYSGAVVSWILPSGDLSLASALAALDPAHVVIEPRSPAKVGKLAEKALPLTAPSRRPAQSPHAYAPKEPCFAALSPLSSPFGKKVDVSAETAFFAALSDAFVVHRLAPDARLCAPGFHHEQTFVPTLLATWLCGAGYVHVPEEHLLSAPSALNVEPPHVLGLSPSFSASLRSSPRALPSSIRAVFRSVADPLDWQETRDALQKNGLAKVPVYNLHCDAAAGGTVLASARRPLGVSARALPSPGFAWDLFDPATKKPSLGRGLFVRRGDAPKDGYFILAEAAGEYLYGGTIAPRRAARVFPSEELSKTVSDLPFVKGASVVALPGAGARGDTHFVLCVFLGAAEPQPAFDATIRKLLSERLSPDYRPDALAMFSLYPRNKGKKTDPDWCSSHYLAGRLHAREKNPAIRNLTELRKELLEG